MAGQFFKTCAIVHVKMSNATIVVDASVLLAVILEEPRKADLLVLTEGATLVAPGCLRWEMGNAFSAMLKRGRLGIDEVSEGLSIFERIPVREMDVRLHSALSLSHRYGIYAYDAYYLDLARRTSNSLLTLDRRMAKIAEKENIDVKGAL